MSADDQTPKIQVDTDWKAEAQAEKDKVEAELAAAILSGTIVWCPTGGMKDCAHVQLRHRHSSRLASGQRRRG